MTRLVWAFQPLPELNGQVQFVECDDELAERLLAADLVQDPQIGMLLLREVTDKPPAPAAPPRDQEYDTKVMTPRRPLPRR